MRLVQELFRRTIVIDEGRVIADGLTVEILKNEELLTEHGWRSRSLLYTRRVSKKETLLMLYSKTIIFLMLRFHAGTETQHLHSSDCRAVLETRLGAIALVKQVLPKL